MAKKKPKPQLTPDHQMRLTVHKQLSQQLQMLVGDTIHLPPLGPLPTLDEALAKVKKMCDDARDWKPRNGN